MENSKGLTGDQLLAVLGGLANPHRVRILAALHSGTNYTSQLARELELSRPLLHMHLKKLEEAGLVTGESRVAEDGKARRYYVVTNFHIVLTAESLADAVETLGEDPRTRTQNHKGDENEYAEKL